MRKTLAFALLYAASLSAATIVYTPSFTTSSPTFSIPSSSGRVNYYSLQSFIVDQTGTYSIVSSNANLVNAFNNDTTLSLYTPSFDPTQPTSNLIAFDDDSGGNFYAAINAVTLTAGNTYFVASSFFDGVGAQTLPASYNVTISGPGAITLNSPAVPEPATYLTVLAGLVAFALFRRR